MADSPVSLPITPAAASSSTPTRVPRRIASNEPASPRPGASSAGLQHHQADAEGEPQGEQIAPAEHALGAADRRAGE
jgi:hypothetical protein